MKITLTGATGFLGNLLQAKLLEEGHELHLLGRHPPQSGNRHVHFHAWDALSGTAPVEAFEGAGAVVHLAGEPVAQRWSSDVKKRIRDSREIGTKAVVGAIGKAVNRPKVLVAASAIGYYGDRGDETLAESAGPGRGFLPEVCVAWEGASDAAAGLGLRVVKLRLGLVLGHGGALEKMLPPFKAGAGGRLGSGKQWMSWIHVDDVVGLIDFVLANEKVHGAVNTAAPHPVRNEEFTTVLGEVLHRPAVVPVPAFAIKMLYGEMSDILFHSQRVDPKAALDAGYEFRYTDLRAALSNLLG